MCVYIYIYILVLFLHALDFASPSNVIIFNRAMLHDLGAEDLTPPPRWDRGDPQGGRSEGRFLKLFVWGPGRGVLHPAGWGVSAHPPCGTRPPHRGGIRISESQILRFSDSQDLRFSEVQILRFSESQNPTSLHVPNQCPGARIGSPWLPTGSYSVRTKPQPPRSF